MLDSVTLSLLILFIFLVSRLCSSQKKIVAGPPGLPILGNLLDIVRNPHQKLSKWATKYGKLFEIKLGMRTALVLSDAKVFREILNKPSSTGRFKTDTYLIISNGPYGLVNSEGKMYQELRQFCVQKLKHFGFGNSSSVEPIIVHEACSLIDWINKKKTEAGTGSGSVCITDIILVVSLNTLWTMVTGESISLDDSRISSLTHKYFEDLQYTVKSGLGFYPWLRYIAPQLSGYNDLKASAEMIRDFIKEQFFKHEQTIQLGDSRDLIDSYIEKLSESEVKEPHSAFHGDVGKINAISCIAELFITGGDTIALTLTWALYYLCTHPQVQDKLYQEISNVIGPIGDGDCSLRHKGKMPYVEAVILETLRKSSLVPLGLFQETLEDLQYENLTIPKGTILIPNIYHIHHDENVWGDPKVFRPERFLQEGNEKLRESLVAFQPGKRSCIGEPLARDVLFLFLVKIIQQFEVFKGNDVDVEEFLKPDVGIMLMPGKHDLIFKSRDK